MRATPSSGSASSTALPRGRRPASCALAPALRRPGLPRPVCRPGIPLGARIVAVCDAYDAMVSDRPYRCAMTREQAITRAPDCAGAQFDPTVVDAFVRASRASVNASAERASSRSPHSGITRIVASRGAIYDLRSEPIIELGSGRCITR